MSKPTTRTTPSASSPPSTTPTPPPDVAFTYDRQGRPLTVTDVLGTRTNVYDALNLLEERYPGGDALVRAYDAYGRAAGIALGADYAVGYGYDSFSRFSTVAVSNGPTFTYTYLPGTSLLAGYANTLGLSVAYAYEPRRDVKTLVSNAWGTNVISTFAYTYDALGRRTVRIDDGLTTNLFAYNLRSELTTAHMSTNLYAYTYDPIGNRLSATENGATTLYAANELNQYTNALAGGRAPTYDLDGNMTSDGEHHFTWDAENRLVGVSPRVLITGSRTYSCEYDHMGRRVKKIEKRHAMAESDWIVHTFGYDAWNLLRERIQAADAMTTNQYTWGIDLSGTLAGAGGIGGLLAATLDGTNLFYTCDANGNITDLSAEDGALLAHYAYAPYGTPTAQSGPLAPLNPFRFSTKYHDTETQHRYYGYRFYTPVLGRWLNRDRLGEADGLNSYAFVQNDSVNWMDDTGLRRRRWGNLAGAHHFIWHFYAGGGNPVDIGSWGYLGHYRSASEVQVFECEARNEARASVDNFCAEDGTQWNGSYTRAVDGTDGLYVMGHGHPNADWTCTMNAGSVTCALSFNITDSFEDPVDLESHVINRLPGWLPRIPDWIVNLGGTPYPLTANWKDTFDGCSAPEDCSTVGVGQWRRR